MRLHCHISITVVKFYQILWYAHYSLHYKTHVLSLFMAPQLLSNTRVGRGYCPVHSYCTTAVSYGLVNGYLLLSLQNCPIDNYSVEKTKSVSGIVFYLYLLYTHLVTSRAYHRIGWEVNFFTSVCGVQMMLLKLRNSLFLVCREIFECFKVCHCL